MSINDSNYVARYATSQADLGASLPGNRLFRWSGAPPVAVLCGSGQDADGVTGPTYDDDGNPATEQPNPWSGVHADPGRPVKVQTGGAFASGASLQSNSSGQAISHVSGPVLLRALEASSGSGQTVWAVWTSGRA